MWTLLIGRICFGVQMNRWQLVGALCRYWVCYSFYYVETFPDRTNAIRYRDVMILATISWAFMAGFLSPKTDPHDVSRTWVTMLLAQVSLGVISSAVFAGGEWLLIDWHIQWSLGLVIALLYVAIGPGVIALGFWGIGVKRVGPAAAGFFINLVPFFAAILSVIFLDELPRPYHAVAFLLIVSGIILSSRGSRVQTND